jgi:hypothetical protein
MPIDKMHLKIIQLTLYLQFNYIFHAILLNKLVLHLFIDIYYSSFSSETHLFGCPGSYINAFYQVTDAIWRCQLAPLVHRHNPPWVAPSSRPMAQLCYNSVIQSCA